MCFIKICFISPTFYSSILMPCHKNCIFETKLLCKYISVPFLKLSQQLIKRNNYWFQNNPHFPCISFMLLFTLVGIMWLTIILASNGPSLLINTRILFVESITQYFWPVLSVWSKHCKLTQQTNIENTRTLVRGESVMRVPLLANQTGL